MTMRWIGTGRSARGAPGLRCSCRLRSLTFALLALSGLFLTGCQSASCGPCGVNPCKSGPCSYLKGLRERVFSRGGAAFGGGGCCGSTLGGEAPLEMGTPAVIAPGATPVLPAAPVESPSELSPAPIERERTPSAEPSGPTGSKSPAGKASYEAARPRYRLGRNASDNLSRTAATTPEPTTRSAQGSIASTASASSDSWLDDLPPLTIPRDDSRNELPDPAPAKPPTETSEKVSASGIDVRLAAPAELSVAPGIRRFVAVEPRLSGGSLPSTAGLDWLAEKGYKTILDLRETSDVQPSFIDEVANRGLRYVALPIGLTKLDAAHVSRFNLELSLSDARPLYFCDADGTRAGALWYIRRMTQDKVDPEVARREAAELGLADKEFLAAASSYLDGLKPATAPATRPAPATSPAPSELETPSAPGGGLDPQAVTEPAEHVSAIEQIPFQALVDVDPRDTTAWRSYAALAVTGLGVPLAYWGRASLPSFRLLSRASLPGPGSRRRSLPPASGV